MPGGSQDVVASILREQSMIEKICVIYSDFVFRHGDWVDWV